MANVDPSSESEIVERAIARVLEAERSAREAIAGARRDAVAMDERARAAARAVAERTERRVARVRERFEQRIAAEVAALDAVAAALDRRFEPDPQDVAALEQAVAWLAAQLTEGSA